MSFEFARQPLVKISIFYPTRGGSRFDVEYYLNTHMPMAARLLGRAIKAITVEIGRPGPDPQDPVPFVAVCGFSCATLDEFLNAFTPVADQLQGDIPNYTDIKPVIQVSEVWTA